MDRNAGISSDLWDYETFTQSHKQSGQESNPRCHQETKNPGRAPRMAAAGHRDRMADFTQFLWQKCSHTRLKNLKKEKLQEERNKWESSNALLSGPKVHLANTGAMCEFSYWADLALSPATLPLLLPPLSSARTLLNVSFIRACTRRMRRKPAARALP